MSRGIITEAQDIPQAWCYVVCIDTFLSGWGKAEGKINTLILPCHSYAEAQWTKAYAESREDTKHVRLCYSKPRLSLSTHYYSLMAREGSAWYPRNRAQVIADMSREIEYLERKIRDISAGTVTTDEITAADSADKLAAES